MHTSCPYAHFPEEPLLIKEQVAALGGSVIRHNFGERCYNPGLTRNHYPIDFLKSDYLMTYRTQEVSNHISVSTLSICGVNKDGTVVWSAPLNLPDLDGVTGTPMHEDGRLFWFNGSLYIAYSNVRLRGDGVTFKQALVALTPEFPTNMELAHVFKPSFKAGVLKNLPYGSNGYAQPGHEKNWQFFDNDGNLAFVYSVFPHVVVTPHNGKHHVSHCKEADLWMKSWGVMHGGTPPIKLPNGKFLSFFNSFVSHHEHQRRYVIGAYLFDGESNNFRISALIDKPLIVASEREGFLWESPVYWEPIVAFASGAHYDAEEKTVRLSYGINDCYAETASIPLASLLSRMVEV